MLSLGRTPISYLIVTNLFMHAFTSKACFYFTWPHLFTLKMFSHESRVPFNSTVMVNICQAGVKIILLTDKTWTTITMVGFSAKGICNSLARYQEMAMDNNILFFSSDEGYIDNALGITNSKNLSMYRSRNLRCEF